MSPRGSEQMASCGSFTKLVSDAERSQRSVISAGVFRDVAPLPPCAKTPSSCSSPFSPSLSAPVTVVVTPLECQSNPKDAAERLKPEGVGQPPQQFRRPLIGDDVDRHFPGEPCHARKQPRRRAARVEREVWNPV